MDTPTTWRYQIVFGDFPGPGGIFGIIKFPTKGNWHKTYAPAIKRMLKRDGQKNDNRSWLLDYDDGTIYQRGNYRNFDFDGKEFVEVTKKDL